MNRFPAEWLALREPVDFASHNKGVLRACEKYFTGRDSVQVCDLGAGTGASVRAFSAQLPKQQTWTLFDHDPENLRSALDALANWGAAASALDGGLTLQSGERQIDVRVQMIDLAETPTPWPQTTDLITASALFDLVSEPWITGFIEALAKQQKPLLAVLTFDGLIEALPGHAFDERVFDAFCAHQGTDKGFGPAAGPKAADMLERILIGSGYKVYSGASPWRMDAGTQDLMNETLKGIAAAAIEIGHVSKDEAEDWLKDRLSNTSGLTVGHRDIFACPQPL